MDESDSVSVRCARPRIAARRCAVVADRDDAALALDTRGYRAICLDRGTARVGARRRALAAAPPQPAAGDRARRHAPTSSAPSELFACGVQEIVVRDASSAASLRARVAGLVAPRVPARPVAASERDRRAQPGHARVPRAGAQGAAQRRDGAPARRDGHGQGGARARDPRRRPARARTVRGDQLRRVPRDAARERAVRPRPRRVHRREPRARRATSCRRTAARCSSTRSARPRSASR